MQELLPIAWGLLLGGLLGVVRPTLRLLVGVVLSLVLGVMATVVTGEASLSWAYVFVDAPLVGCAALAGLTAGRHLRPITGTSLTEEPRR